MKAFKYGAARALFLSTTAFAISFAIWGLIGALAPTLAQTYGLSGKARSLMIALPVLIGALGTIPAGMLADRFGGQRVLAALLLLSAVSALLVGFSRSYEVLIGFGMLLGIAGSTFPVGIGFTSKWFTPDQQGTALGVYGLGTMGQSIVVFVAPVLAIILGSWQPVFFVFAAISAIWAAVFFIFARDAPAEANPRTLTESLSLLSHEPLAWVLSLFYFLTFGGFIAIALYLPVLLIDSFNLSTADAGFRTAGFVLLATLMRPIGGMLADRKGGARVLTLIFTVLAVFATLLSNPWLPIFTIGALGAAAALGIGNGAVFNLVPRHFPKETATVTGLVGAFGCLGGFFPPLVLGVLRDATGRYTWGFIFLAFFSLLCLVCNYFAFFKSSRRMNSATAIV